MGDDGHPDKDISLMMRHRERKGLEWARRGGCGEKGDTSLDPNDEKSPPR